MNKQAWIFTGILAIATTAYAGIIVHGQLVDASLENLSSAPTAQVGRVYFNTSTNEAQIYNGTAWAPMPGLQASSTASGYLSSADWTTFNTASVGVTSVAGTSPISSSGGQTPTISISKAGITANGYLASADWQTFNSKQSTLSPASSTVNGYLASTDWMTFNSKQSALSAAAASVNGYLSSSDWITFNAKDPARVIGNLTDVGTDGLTVTSGTGAIIGSGTSLSQHVADLTHNGYLASADWLTFNAKDPARTVGNLTEATSAILTITGGTGAVIGTGTTIAVIQAGNTASGYLSSTDWQTFNSISRVKATSSVNGYLASGDWTTFNQIVTASQAGRLSTGADTVAGNKTFTGQLAVGSTNSGTQTHAVTGNFTISNVYSATVTSDSSTGTVNALGLTSTVTKLTASTTMTLNGITAASVEGSILILVNQTGNSITVNDESGSASAANQIVTNGLGVKTIPQGGSAWFVYVSSRWRMIISG